MVKRLFVFFSILCAALVLGSCSDSLENKSSLAFEVSEAFFRNVIGDSVSTDGSSQTSYTVKVTVSWENDQNMVQEQSATVNDSGEVSCPTFTFKDLPTGKTVSVDVSIYSGNVLVYKTETPVEKQLVAGENNCKVELTKCVSDIVISIQNKDEINLDSAKEYKLRATFSGDYARTSEWTLTAADNTFRVENLDIGKSVELDVAVYSGDLCVYKTENPVSIKIAEKNEIAVTLVSCIQTAVVWQDCVTKESGNNTYNFFQSKSFDVEQETSALIEKPNSDSYNNDVIYTFDGEGNLWTAITESTDSGKNATFKKYLMENGLYKTEAEKTYDVPIGVDDSIKDIYWDNGTLYALVFNSGNYYLNSYEIENGSFANRLNLQISLPSELATSPSLSTLAVNGLKVFVGSENSVILFWNIITGNAFLNETFTGLEISGFSEITASIGIYDLQIGDGLGNNTDNLYALIRSCTSYIASDTSTIYSNGALVEIDVNNYTVKLYGNNIETQTISIIDGTNTSGKDHDFICPNINDNENFFGPAKFVALVPKKLVILDDGLSADDSNKKLINNDYLFEFDIASKVIVKGAKVTSSVPETSGEVLTDW